VNVPKELEPLLFSVADLVELPGNPRRGDVDAVARSYEAFGQRKPIVVRRTDDGSNVVVAGNHQLEAARQLGWEQIAVVWTDDLTDDQAKAFALADNRIADLGTYDNDDLLVLLSEVDDLDGTGYTDLDVADLAALVNYDPMGSIDDLLGEVGDLDGSEGNVSLRLDLTAPVLDQWKDHRKGFDTDDEALAYLMDK
jgi:ParB-like chromosome segregation protein Spo0J